MGLLHLAGAQPCSAFLLLMRLLLRNPQNLISASNDEPEGLIQGVNCFRVVACLRAGTYLTVEQLVPMVGVFNYIYQMPLPLHLNCHQKLLILSAFTPPVCSASYLADIWGNDILSAVAATATETVIFGDLEVK